MAYWKLGCFFLVTDNIAIDVMTLKLLNMSPHYNFSGTLSLFQGKRDIQKTQKNVSWCKWQCVYMCVFSEPGFCRLTPHPRSPGTWTVHFEGADCDSHFSTADNTEMVGR